MNWLIGVVAWVILAFILAVVVGRRLREADCEELRTLVKELQDLTIDQQVEIGRLRVELAQYRDD